MGRKVVNFMSDRDMLGEGPNREQIK